MAKFKRVFQYNDKNLPDPDARFTLEKVIRFYVSTFPELKNATITGASVDGHTIIYVITSF